MIYPGSESMKIPVFCVDATSIDKYTSKVFKMYEIEYFLYIHIPHELRLEYAVFQIDEVSPTAQKCDLMSYIHQECGKPWIRIPSSYLDLSVGLHVYRLSFVNKYTDDVISIYFSYILQTDDPAKPYIYMNDNLCGCN